DTDRAPWSWRKCRPWFFVYRVPEKLRIVFEFWIPFYFFDAPIPHGQWIMLASNRCRIKCQNLSAAIESRNALNRTIHVYRSCLRGIGRKHIRDYEFYSGFIKFPSRIEFDQKTLAAMKFLRQ